MKKITHSIGGQERTLDVGKMWFTKYFGEATSSDPLFMNELLSKPDKQFDFITGLVYAGINCNNKTIGSNELITIEQAQDLVGNMDQSEAAELINKFVDVNKVKAEGEDQTQAKA